jgi:hypothetical protein
VSAQAYLAEQAARAAEREMRDHVGLMSPDEFRRHRAREWKRQRRSEHRRLAIVGVVGVVLLAAFVVAAGYLLVHLVMAVCAVIAIAAVVGILRAVL